MHYCGKLWGVSYLWVPPEEELRQIQVQVIYIEE